MRLTNGILRELLDCVFRIEHQRIAVHGFNFLRRITGVPNTAEYDAENDGAADATKRSGYSAIFGESGFECHSADRLAGSNQRRVGRP